MTWESRREVVLPGELFRYQIAQQTAEVVTQLFSSPAEPDNAPLAGAQPVALLRR
jgi:hypothetical protein